MAFTDKNMGSASKLKKIRLVLFLMGYLVVIGIVNQIYQPFRYLGRDRGLASINDPEALKKQESWEKDVIARIDTNSAAGTAKMGQPPSPLDQLMYGELKGEYTLKIDNSIPQEPRRKTYQLRHRVDGSVLGRVVVHSDKDDKPIDYELQMF
jgi:hypothetical protein